MKIFHIDRQRSWTGQINHTMRVVEGLRDRGHEAGVVGHPGSQLVARAREGGIEAIEIPMRGWRTYRSAWRLGSALKGRGVDVLHAHGPKDHQVALFAAWRGDVRHLLRTKHNHTPLKGGAFSRWMYRKCSRVVTVSEFVRDKLIEDGIDPDHVVAIHSGVDVDRLTPRPRDEAVAEAFGVPPGARVVGNVSSLHSRKGIEEVLRAFRLLVDRGAAENLVCLLVGRRFEQWLPLVRELDLEDRVVMPGFHRDVPGALSLLDVYVMPSREEALGTSVLEAMAMELPVVASNEGGFLESVTAETGVLVPVRDPGAVADAVEALLADPERRRAMGAAGRVRVTERFQEKHLVDKMLALYESLDDEPGARSASTSS